MNATPSVGDRRIGGGAGAFLRTFVAAAASLAGLAFAALLLLDPHSTGRGVPPALDRITLMDGTPAKTAPARIRHPSFDAYVLGNSTLQTLSPERLNALTGRSFAQITAPGTGPMEQAAMLRHLSRTKGERLSSVVLGLDLTWCDPKGMTTTSNPFPFWLYAETFGGYARGLFRMDNLEALPRRLSALAGGIRASRADGWWNYEAHVPPRPYPFDLPAAPVLARPPHSAAALLGEALAALPAGTRAAIVLSPVYRPPGDGRDYAAALRTDACKAELLATARSRPRTFVVDRWRDDALHRERRNFLDAIHFLEPIARAIERETAAALTD